MKKITKKFLNKINDKFKHEIGLPTNCEICKLKINQYNNFIQIKQELDEYAQGEVALIPDMVVNYKWKDVDAIEKMSKENLLVLKSQIEVLKHSGASAKELANINISYNCALKKAIANYIDNYDDYKVNSFKKQLNNYLKENKYDAFKNIICPKTKDRLKEINKYNEITFVTEEVKRLKLKLMNSENFSQPQFNKRK